MVLQLIARGGAAQRVVLPRRSFLKGLIGLIVAPAVVKAETLMPIVVWKPTFYCVPGRLGYPKLLTCEKSDLIGVDLASLGLPPPYDGWLKPPNAHYWAAHRFPLEDLPRDRVHIPHWHQQRWEQELDQILPRVSTAAHAALEGAKQ